MSTLAAALDLAGRGWCVLPIAPARDGQCGCARGAKCEKPGKHPLRQGWQRSATSDPEQVRAQWSDCPDANIGIATGPGSGLVVIDVDPRHGGREALAALEQQHGALPATVRVLTGGGGEHIYFRHPADTVCRSWSTEGIDVQAARRLVVAPGSTHASGRQYVFDPSAHPDCQALADPPSWLLKRVTSNAKRTPKRRAADRSGDIITEGTRNVTLTRFAGAIKRAGAANPTIPAALHAQNEALCRPPLPRSEIDAIAQSAAGWLPPWFTGPAFYEDPRLSAAERHVLRILVDHANHEGKTFVGQRRIAQLGRLGNTTVCDAMRGLERAGRLVRSDRTTSIRPFSPVVVASPTTTPGSSVPAVGTVERAA